ncbi:hypothetical protein ERO13_D06G118900v2 [Gossypium hirsutum]|nr:hypothetical protein ERO13_D06G118900v2 [Gossypium hirsutum]
MEKKMTKKVTGNFRQCFFLHFIMNEIFNSLLKTHFLGFVVFSGLVIWVSKKKKFSRWADKYRVPDINKYLHCNDDTITFF